MVGKLPKDVLDALLDTIPLELTVLDEHDRVVGWNSGRPRLFERAPEIIGTDVRSCHSEKSLGTVDRLLREMKEGTRETARFWYDEVRNGVSKKVLVQYFALRDQSGRYLGSIEALQDIEEIRSLVGEKRTLD